MTWTQAFASSGNIPRSGVETGAGAAPKRWLAAIGGALSRDDPVAHRHLLLLRFALANLVAVALVAAAAAQGWIGVIVAADGAVYALAIAAVFAAGLLWSAQAAVQISREIDHVKRYAFQPICIAPAYLRQIAGRDGQSRAIRVSTLKLTLAARIAPIRHIANALVLLGLIGTVLGFIIALSGVRPEAAANVGAVGPMISTLINGMSIALHTTLVGSLLHLWLMVNVRLLEGGTVTLLAASVDLGEVRANA